jgi:CheY-like chemotaxis protein
VTGGEIATSPPGPAAEAKQILVVDDETDLLATYERLLRRHGYAVVPAASREAGLSAVRSGRPALVVTDLRLPDGDGLDVVHAARASAFLPKQWGVRSTPGRASSPHPAGRGMVVAGAERRQIR